MTSSPPKPSFSPLLPVDFLSGPTPVKGGIKRTPLNFKKGGLPSYEGMYAVVLDNCLSVEECEAWIAAAEAHSDWQPALVNMGGNLQILATEARKCGRIIWDDRDLVQRLWERVEGAVPEVKTLGEKADKGLEKVLSTRKINNLANWEMSRLNERMRILKYGPGDYFRGHCDGNYTDPETDEVSYLTLHLYLNDGATNEEKCLKGGATSFLTYSRKGEKKMAVNPKAGSVLIFQQRFLQHEGSEIDKGTKITLRTDVMYKIRPDSKLA